MSRVALPVHTEMGSEKIDFKPVILSPMSEESGMGDEPNEAGLTSPRVFSKDSYVSTEEGTSTTTTSVEDNVKSSEEVDEDTEMNEMNESPTPHEIYCEAKDLERKEDYKQAMELFGQAAEQGHLSSMVSYALLLVSTDEAMAYEWLSTAADHGNGRAFYHLGQLFARGALFRISPSTAAKCWHQSAALGDSGGRSALGLCYIRGFGVKQDVEKGVAMVKQVAEVHQDLCAMKNLSWIYRHGKGVPKDEGEADLWWKKAVSRQSELKAAEENWVSWKINPV